ncbi:MAG TPA: hypothetical protein VGL72_27145 [Bryobacteraceae bacterium]|jgi:hypothetical protein
MGVNSAPLRWPAAWKDTSPLSLLQATPIRCLVTDSPVAGLPEAARSAGITVIEAQSIPSNVTVVKGVWPGIRLSAHGGDRASAGPTGEPWIDSNGWRIRVAQAQHPDAQIWVDAKPQPSRVSTGDYVVAFADIAAHRASWIITLDDALATGIASRNADALAAWKRLADTAAFFADDPVAEHDDAVIGVLSTFSGPRVGFTSEVLNNLARTRQLYRAISASRLASAALDGLKGVIYTDAGEPAGEVRKLVLDFVNAGGTLITGAGWGSLPKGEERPGVHPRFDVRGVGKGSIAVGATLSDPYRVPNDAVTLVSHRQDLVRYFNSGAITPCLYHSADKKRATLQTVLYSLRPVEDATIWVKGSYRTGRLRTWPKPQPLNIKLNARDAGVEIHLPAVAQYAAIELEA